MNLAFRLLVLLIAVSPLFLISDSLLIHGVLMAYVALMVLVVALSIPPGEAAFLWSVIRPTVLIAIFPAVWITLQTLPLPFNGVRHPIWMSAETALGRSLWGSISMSPGETFVALARYFCACGLFFVAAAVTIDRRRAETILITLSAFTASMALLLIVHNLGGFVFLGEISSIGPRAAITAAIMLGAVLASSTAVYAIERYETRRSRADFSRRLFIAMIAASLAALSITLLALLLFASKPASFAALSGLGTFILIVGFRRIGLVRGMGYLVAAVVVAVPLSLVAGDFFTKGTDLTLRSAVEAAGPSISLAQRMISDASWAGSGAGAYAALVPIYQDSGNTVTSAVAPTMAAELLIDLGRPALWLVIALALAAIAWLTHGALQRGRDSFFTAAGAGCSVVLILEAFFDASLASSGTIVLATTVLGLAVSQSISRTAR